MKQKDWVIISLLVLGWIVFLGQPTGVSTRLRVLLVQLTTPFVKLADWLPTVHARRALAQDNLRLRAENDRLRRQVGLLQEAAAENLTLRQQLKFKEQSGLHLIGARVIGRDAGNWWKTIQLDRGSQDGVRVDVPVLSADGLVGKTIAVTRGESRVLLLLDPNCKVGALLKGSRETGVVSGMDEGFTTRPRCQMTYVAQDVAVRAGEAVISSGLGGVFPKGIPLGKVVSAQAHPQSGLYQEVVVEPAVDFRRLEEVLVLVE